MSGKMRSNRQAITRRQFLRSASGLAVGAGATALLGACAPKPTPTATAAPAAPTKAPVAASTQPPAPTVAPTKAPTAVPPTPTPAGPTKTLTIAVQETAAAEGWLPNMVSTVAASPRGAVYDHPILTDPNDRVKLVPGLFESWTVKDLKEFTFRLRKGVQWQKGYGEVTADDVAFTLELITRADSKAIDGAFWRDRVKKMKVVDPYTITFTFDAFEPELTWMLSTHSHQKIVCKKYVETVGIDKANTEPVGSGPYKLVKSVPQSEYELDPSGPIHWRVNPKWAKIRCLNMPNEVSRLALLDSGRADITAITMEQVDECRGKGYAIYTSDDMKFLAYIFGGLFNKGHKLYTGKEPWHDIRVREAMNLAIDRDAINKTMFAGIGVIENVMGNAVASPDKTTAPLKIPYDPARAKALLAEAGYEKGFAFDLVSYPPQYPQVTQVVAASWEAIGLRPTIKMMDQASWRSKVLKDETNGVVYSWVNDFRVAFQARFEKFFYSKVEGFGIYYDDHLDSVYETLTKTGDQAEREKMLHDTMVYLRKQWAAVPIVSFPGTVFAASPKTIAGWKPLPRTQWGTFEYIDPA